MEEAERLLAAEGLYDMRSGRRAQAAPAPPPAPRAPSLLTRARRGAARRGRFTAKFACPRGPDGVLLDVRPAARAPRRPVPAPARRGQWG